MKSNQVFLSNKNNLIRDAILSASSVSSATGTARPIAIDRVGLGVVQLTGAYTGSEPAQFDIQITDDSLGATPQASVPILTGAGNGAITDVAIDAGTAAQDVTFTLRELAVAA